MVIKIRTVYGGMACSTETGTSWHTVIMIRVSHTESTRICLGLIVTPETEIRIPCNKEFVIHGTMYFVANSTALSHRVMFKDKWSPLLRMTFKTHLAGVRKRCY